MLQGPPSAGPARRSQPGAAASFSGLCPQPRCEQPRVGVSLTWDRGGVLSRRQRGRTTCKASQSILSPHPAPCPHSDPM